VGESNLEHRQVSKVFCSHRYMIKGLI
jgi:hypothetical protein